MHGIDFVLIVSQLQVRGLLSVYGNPETHFVCRSIKKATNMCKNHSHATIPCFSGTNIIILRFTFKYSYILTPKFYYHFHLDRRAKDIRDLQQELTSSYESI